MAAPPQFSHDDRALLEGLANIKRAVGSASVRLACEQFRDTLLRQRDRQAIGAEALRLFLQARGDDGCIDVQTAEWTEFFQLAEGIEGREEREDHRRSSHGRRQGDSVRASQASFRQLRATARLTALWGFDILEHYGFTHWNPKKLEGLARCAEVLPDFRDFALVANCVLLQRHGSSLTCNRIDRIGQHTLANQHALIATAPRPDQPLQNKDVVHTLSFLLGKESVTVNGHRCDSREQLLEHRTYIDEWVQDETGDVSVAGKALKAYDRYSIANYHLEFDLHGMLVPEAQWNNVQSRVTRQGKRKRQDYVAAAPARSDPGRIGFRREARERVPHMHTPPLSSPEHSTRSSPQPTSPLETSGSELEGRVGSLIPHVGTVEPSDTEHVNLEEVNSWRPGGEFFAIPDPGVTFPLHALAVYASPDADSREENLPHTALLASTPDQLRQSDRQAVLQPSIDQPSRNLQYSNGYNQERRDFPLPASFTEHQQHTCLSARIVQVTSDPPAQATREVSTSCEAVMQSPAFGPTWPMASEFDEQFAFRRDYLTPIDRTGEVCPSRSSFPSVDFNEHAIFDLAHVYVKSPTLPESPHSFSSLVTTDLTLPSSAGALPRFESPVPSHPSDGLVEAISTVEESCVRDAVADAWLRLPELHRDERSKPFTDEAGNDKVYVATPEQVQAAVCSGFKFKKPIITKYGFLDSHIHTPERLATDLRRFYPTSKFQVRFRDDQVRSMGTRKIADMIKEPASEPHSILKLGALSRSHVAPFLLNSRFRLLDALIERTKQNLDAGKRIESVMPADAESLEFGILGFPGAFSPPHLDNMVGCQFRTLFGKQRMMIVLYNELTDKERAEFALAGRQWCPPMHKGQVIRLEGNDVVLVPPGVEIVRAVFTDELSLTECGSLWDFLAVKDILWGFVHVLEHSTCATGPATQLPTRLLDQLEGWACDEPELFTDGDQEQFRNDLRVVLERLRSTGCNCAECIPGRCSCEMSKRQCTEWCRSHVAGSDCMLRDLDL